MFLTGPVSVTRVEFHGRGKLCVYFTAAVRRMAQHLHLHQKAFFMGCSSIDCSVLVLSRLHRSSEDQSEGDLLHQRRHQNRAGDQEQDHLQAERRDGEGPEEDGAVAEGRAAVHLRGDERHQRALPGHGPEDGRPPGHHLSEALAEGTARVQEDFPEHPQAAVLKEGPEFSCRKKKVYFLFFL